MDIGAIAPLFDPSEAERVVQELTPVSILELGTTKCVGLQYPQHACTHASTMLMAVLSSAFMRDDVLLLA